jgi:hypothetical protein
LRNGTGYPIGDIHLRSAALREDLAQQHARLDIIAAGPSAAELSSATSLDSWIVLRR